MADKGFVIGDICHQIGIKLYRLPFLRNDKQLQKDEAIYNTKIAAARVHIERTNQRIKLFKTFRAKMQWNIVSYIDNIFTITRAIIMGIFQNT